MNKLLHQIADDNTSLPDRIRFAHQLADIGDPRAVHDPVHIQGGSFLYRDQANVTHTVQLSSFWIDRYPVTVQQYEEFISSNGYVDPQYWSKEGWRWRVEQSILAPRFWGDSEWSNYLIANHPVVGVSYFEAEAYATFRNGQLPTDAQWERACRSMDGRLYPWGNDWIDNACAMRGVGPRSTCPIGIFSKGISPEGVFDLVGCVWQWCRDALIPGVSSENIDPFYNPSAYPSSVQRVTRGGAWNTPQWSVNATSRNGYEPGARFSNIGFRCVFINSSVDGIDKAKPKA